MPGFHHYDFNRGATLAIERDPDRPGGWLIEVSNEQQNEYVKVRVYGGELQLELEPPR